MSIRIVLKKTAQKAVLFLCITFAHPSYAFLWPTIDVAQIAPFVNNVQTGLSQVQAAKSQIDNFTSTVSAIGDQVGSIAKYAADLDGMISNLVNSLEKIVANVIKINVDVQKILGDVDSRLEEAQNAGKIASENTYKDTEAQIDEGASQEDVQDSLNEAKQEAESRKNEINEMLNEAARALSESLDNADAAVDQLMEVVTNHKELDEQSRQELENDAKAIKIKINNLKNTAAAVLNEIKANYNLESDKINEAYNNYSKAIDDYFAGKISREELSAAGEAFQNVVSSAGTGIDKNKLDNILKETAEISSDIENLKEKILDSVSNNKDYSDDSEKTSALKEKEYKKYAFNFYDEKTHISLKSVYSTDDKSFLLSKELQCKNLKIEDIEKDSNHFRDCVIWAKTEKEYFCPSSPDQNCNPFKIESMFKKYQKNGVYKHILEDYSTANIVNISKIKQYTATWQDAENSKSTLLVLVKTLEDVSNTRDAYIALGMIEIEAPRLWSKLRQIDAVYRAKEIVKRFDTMDTFYLDGRDDDYLNASSSKNGIINVETKDGETMKKAVFPNVMLYKCDLTGEDVSVAADEKQDNEKIRAAEKAIADCMFKYAEAAGKGTRDGVAINEGNYDLGKQQGRIDEDKALGDTSFETLVLSTINNYKSSKDYATPKNGETNIVSAQKGLENATQARNDYAALALINYYSTQQLLSIVDADAQSLQTEIIKDLNTMEYNFFPDSNIEGGE